MRAGRMSATTGLILSSGLVAAAVLAGNEPPCPPARRETSDGCAASNRDSNAVRTGQTIGGKA